MSVPYEKIVEEDLNIGRGEVEVTNPGGGSLTGNKIGIQTFPAIGFSASRSSNQSISASSVTTVQLSTEELDTEGWYDDTTYTFTPLEAGLYLFTAQLTMASLTGTITAYLYKNASEAWKMEAIRTAAVGTVQVSGIIALNGSDAVTLRVQQTSAGAVNLTAARLSGLMIGNQ